MFRVFFLWLFIFYLFIFISIFISIAGKKVLHTIARLSAEILLIIFVSIEYPTKLLVDLFHTCIFLDKGRQVYVKGHVGDTVNSFSRFDHPCVTPESSTMKVSVWCLVTSLIWLLIYFLLSWRWCSSSFIYIWCNWFNNCINISQFNMKPECNLSRCIAKQYQWFNINWIHLSFLYFVSIPNVCLWANWYFVVLQTIIDLEIPCEWNIRKNWLI